MDHRNPHGALALRVQRSDQRRAEVGWDGGPRGGGNHGNPTVSCDAGQEEVLGCHGNPTLSSDTGYEVAVTIETLH